MADHQSRSLDLIEEVADLRASLAEAYAQPRQDRALIADLHQRIGISLKLADIHATHSVRQELQEIATGLQLRGIRP